MNTKKINLKKGFTLMELLVVISIIGVLTTIVLLALAQARDKGADGAIKSNLSNARSQAEVFYNTNTANPLSYAQVCETGPVGGAQTIGSFIVEASKSSASAGVYSIDAAGGLGQVTCNQSANAWAAEAPTRTDGNEFWCVDSTGISKQVSGTSFSSPTDYVCD